MTDSKKLNIEDTIFKPLTDVQTLEFAGLLDKSVYGGGIIAYMDCLQRDNFAVAIRELVKVKKDLLEALKIAEWTPPKQDGASYCNCCGRDKWNGHNSICQVKAAIAQAEANEQSTKD